MVQSFVICHGAMSDAGPGQDLGFRWSSDRIRDVDINEAEAFILTIINNQYIVLLSELKLYKRLHSYL